MIPINNYFYFYSETSFSQSKYSKASDSGLNMCIDDVNYKERPIVHEKVSKVTRYSEETSDSRRYTLLL